MVAWIDGEKGGVIYDGRMANVDAIVNKPVRVTYFSDY